MKRILVSLAVLGLLVGAAQAQENKTMAVSVPTADHGWTGGVVFHAMAEAKALEKKYPGLKVIVKTSPDPAAQADALEDLSTQGIDAMRVDAFNAGIKGTKIKVIDSQFGNWSRDDAFKVMQDFLTKHPKIDAVWCQDDDMAIGVFEAIAQAKRTDIKFVVAGAGAKDMVKRVMDGDPMMPVDVLYSPTMVAVAMDVTALGLEDKIPVRGEYILKASLITKDNAKD